MRFETKNVEFGVEIIGFDSDETTVIIPAEIDGSPVISIGREVFWNCYFLKNVTIPVGVIYIRAGAFANCISLEEVILSKGLCEIGQWAFTGCSKLTSINIPDSVVYIGAKAFFGCSSMMNIKLPGGIRYIGEKIFDGCPMDELYQKMYPIYILPAIEKWRKNTGDAASVYDNLPVYDPKRYKLTLADVKMCEVPTLTEE